MHVVQNHPCPSRGQCLASAPLSQEMKKKINIQNYKKLCNYVFRLRIRFAASNCLQFTQRAIFLYFRGKSSCHTVVVTQWSEISGHNTVVVTKWSSNSSCHTVVIAQWFSHSGCHTRVLTQWLSHSGCHTVIVLRQSVRQMSNCHKSSRFDIVYDI